MDLQLSGDAQVDAPLEAPGMRLRVTVQAMRDDLLQGAPNDSWINLGYEKYWETGDLEQLDEEYPSS